MNDISYKVKLLGDTSALEKAITDASGLLKKISDDEFIISLRYDGNIKDFNSQIDKIISLAPDIPVDFKYNINKKVLEKEIEKLSAITEEQMQNVFNISSDEAIKKQIDSITNYIKKKGTELEDGTFVFGNEKDIDTISKKLRDLYANVRTGQEYISNYQVPKEFMKFISFITSKTDGLEGFGHNIKPKEGIFDTKAIEDQQKKIELMKNLVNNLEKDMTGNNAIENSFAASTKQISELLSKLKDIQDELKKIGDKIPDFLEKPLEGILDEKGINEWKNSFLSALNEIKAGFQGIFSKENKSELSEVLNGYFNDDYLHEVTYGKKSPIERSFGLSTKTGKINGKYSIGKEHETALANAIIEDAFEQAEEGIDVFLHTHPSNIAAMSLPTYQETVGELGELIDEVVGADFISSIHEYKKGIKKQLIQAGGDILLFDTEAFLSDFGKYFQDKDSEEKIKNIIANNVEDFKDAFDENFAVFLQRYIQSMVGDFSGSDLFSSLLLSSGIGDSSLLKNIKDKGLDQRFTKELVSKLGEADFTDETLGISWFEIIDSILDGLKGELTGAGELIDKTIIDKIKKSIINRFGDKDSLEEYIYKNLDISTDDVFQYSYRNAQKGILKNSFAEFDESFDPDSFDFSKYMKVWEDFEDFIKENPLNLPENNDLFGIGEAEKFLDIIGQIKSILDELSNINLDNFSSVETMVNSLTEAVKLLQDAEEIKLNITPNVDDFINKFTEGIDENGPYLIPIDFYYTDKNIDELIKDIGNNEGGFVEGPHKEWGGFEPFDLGVVNPFTGEVFELTKEYIIENIDKIKDIARGRFHLAFEELQEEFDAEEYFDPGGLKSFLPKLFESFDSDKLNSSEIDELFHNIYQPLKKLRDEINNMDSAVGIDNVIKKINEKFTNGIEKVNIEINIDEENFESQIKNIKRILENLENTPVNIKLNAQTGDQLSANINSNEANIMDDLKIIAEEFGEMGQDFFQAIKDANGNIDKFINTLEKHFTFINDPRKVVDALLNAGFVDEFFDPTFKAPDVGMCHDGVAVGEKYVILGRGVYGEDLDEKIDLAERQNRAADRGAKVPHIVMLRDNENGGYVEIQEALKGVNLREANVDDINNINISALKDWLLGLREIFNEGLQLEVGGDNQFLDENGRLFDIDLAAPGIYGNVADNIDDAIEAFLRNAQMAGSWSKDADIDALIEKLSIAIQELQDEGHGIDAPRFKHDQGISDFYSTNELSWGGTNKDSTLFTNTGNYSQSFKEEESVVNSVINSEIELVNLLSGAITALIEKIDAKTDAFASEADVVRNAINLEIGDIDLLTTSLDYIINRLEEINTSILEINNNKLDLGIDSNPHFLTDELGEVKTFYRGLRDMMGGGLTSERFGGASFWTDNFDLAKEYAQWGKVEKAQLAMRNPFEIDAKGANWNQVEYLGDYSDEASKKITEASKVLNEALETYKEGIKEGFDFRDLTSLKGINEFQKYIKEFYASINGSIEIYSKEEIQEIIDKVKQAREDYIEVANDPSNLYGKHNTKEWVSLIQGTGEYDGVIFKNIVDSARGFVTEATNVAVQFNDSQTKFIETLTSKDNLNERDIEAILKYYNRYIEDLKEVQEQLPQDERNYKRGLITSSELENTKNQISELQEQISYLEQVLPLLTEYKNRLIEIQDEEIPHSSVFIPEDLSEKSISNLQDGIQKIYKDIWDLKDVSSLDVMNKLDVNYDDASNILEKLQEREYTEEELLALSRELYDQRLKEYDIETMINAIKRDRVDEVANEISEKYSNNSVNSEIDSYREEENVVEEVVSNEILQLNALKEKIDEICNSINLKTTAFKEEGVIVDSTINEELAKLNELKDSLNEIKISIQDISTGFEGIKDFSFNGKIKIDGLSLLKDDNFADKLTRLYINLDDFAKAVNNIDFNNNIVKDLNTILAKGKELKDLASILKSNKKESIKAVKDNVNKEEIENVKNYEEAYKTLISTEERYRELIAKQQTSLLTEKEAKELSNINSDRTQAEKKIQDIVKATSGEIKKQSDAEQKYTDQVNKTVAALKAGAEAREKLEAANNRDSLINSLQKEIESLNKIEFAPRFTDEFGDKIRHEIDKANDALQGTNEQIEQAIKDVKKFKDTIPKNALEGSYTALDKDALDISQILEKNTKMSSKMKAELLELYDTVIRYRQTGLFEDKDLIRIKNRIIEIKDEISRTGQTGKSMTDKLKQQLAHVWRQDIARYFGINDILRYMRTAFSSIHELDTALVDLRKTTTMSTEELNEFYYASNNVAQNVGVTTKDIISQAAAWSRLGYSSQEAATTMAELSSKFAQISPGMDVNTATDGLVSSMKAFGFEVDEVERNVMDNINRIGNTMATTNEEIVNMLERSSAAMSAANNTIEQTIALESAAVQVTRNAETTGTAFRTISMRIRGYDEETEEELEDYEELKGKIADLTKTAKTPGGISLFSDKEKTTFKSTYQLLKDISEIWDELTDKEQAQLTEKLAGKRGGQVLSAVMNDFDEVERAMTEMSNAAGSSDKEMEIIEESIDYKLNAIKQSWVGFMQEVLGRQELGNLFDSLLKGSESLQKTLSTLTPVISPLIEALAKLIDILAEFNTSTGGMAGILGLIFGGAKVKFKIDSFKGLIGNLLGTSKNKKDKGGLLDWLKQPLSELFNKDKTESIEDTDNVLDPLIDSVDNASEALDNLADSADNAAESNKEETITTEESAEANVEETTATQAAAESDTNEALQSELAAESDVNEAIQSEAAAVSDTNEAVQSEAAAIADTNESIATEAATIGDTNEAIATEAATVADTSEAIGSGIAEAADVTEAVGSGIAEAADISEAIGSGIAEAADVAEAAGSVANSAANTVSTAANVAGGAAGTVAGAAGAAKGIGAGAGALGAVGGISVGAALGILAAVATAGFVAYKVYDHFNISVEEATEYMTDWNKALTQNETKLNSQKQLVDDAKNSYLELAKGVNTTNNTNINLSDSEYREFISYNNRLAEQFPELQTGVDEFGNAIIDLGDNSVIASEKLDSLIENAEQLNNIEIADALPDSFDNEYVLLKENYKNINKYKKELDDYYESLNKVKTILGSGYSSGIYETTNIDTKNLLVQAMKDAGLYNLIDSESGIAGNRISGYDEETGQEIWEFYIDSFMLDENQKAALNKAIEENVSSIETTIQNEIFKTQTKLQDAESKVDLDWESFVLKNFLPATHSTVLYHGLDEEGKQIADALVSSMTSEMAGAIDQYGDPVEFIQEKILRGLEDLQNKDFTSLTGDKLSVMDLFNGELSGEELVNLYNQIQEYFNQNGIEIKLNVGEVATQNQKKLEKNIQNIAFNGTNLSDRGFSSSRGVSNSNIKKNEEELKTLREFTSKLTDDEIELWNKITEGSKSATEAIERYKEAVEESGDASEELLNTEWTKGKMIDQLNEMSDGFDKLDEVYADIYDKGGFDFAKLSSKKFNEAFGDLGVNYEEFIETIAGHTDDIEYCQDAFNSLVDEYIKSTGVLDHVTEANKDVTESILEMYGITNAHELVEQALIKTEAKAIVSKYNLADATSNDTQKLVEEIGAADGVKASLIAAEAAEVLFANASLNADQKISELNRIASAAWGAAAAMELSNLTDNRGFEHSFNPADYDENYIEHAWEKIQAKYSKMASTAIVTPEYGGGKATQTAIDKANKSGEESKEILDWIEKALQRQEEEINRIDKVVNATYKNWSTRNSALLNEITEINKEIGMQQAAYQAYMRDAEAVPLAENYKKLVREGAMFAETITDKTLKKNIDHYTELYDKAIKAKDAVEDLIAKIAQLAKMKFDNVKSEFEGFTSEIEHFVNMIDKELSHVEAIDKIAGKSFYKAKIDQDAQKLEDLNKERTALLSALREAEANGIEEGSADWISMRNDIYAVDESIAELTYEVEELRKKMKEVAKLNFDDLKSQFENAISIITGQIDLTDTVVSMTQNAGYIASREYYKALIDGSKENVTGLRKEYETLSKTLADAMSAGDIEKYDEQWYAMQQDITNVKKELVDAANATIEYANALRQIDWDVFDRGVDRISKLVDESEFFIELLSYSDLFDKDSGDWTKEGTTTRGLMVQEYQTYVDQANAYGEEAEEIRKLLETDPKNTTLIDRYYELIEAQRQAILNSKKEKKAIEDLYKDAYDNLLDRIKKLIDAYKDALNAAKDLHDYQNSIEEKTKAVSDIQKQLIAYSGDDSEETRATLQKLNTDLIAAQKDLEQTEYEKYIQDQENLLDQFYSELEEWLNGRMDELGSLFEEAIAATNLNGKLIDDTLHDVSDSVNYRMTDEFSTIWDNYAAEDGIAANSLNILTLVNDMSNSIRVKMDELPTEARLEEFFNGDDLRLLQQLTSVNYNTQTMINSIRETNDALNHISSNIVEWSGRLGEKIDYAGSRVASAIASIEFSSDSGSYDAPSGGGGSSSGGGSPKTTTTPKTGNTRTENYYVTGYSPYGGTPYRNDNLTLAEAQKIEKDFEKLGGSIIVHHYAKGGLIGKNNNILDSIAKLLGEDHMIAAKEGERILTEDQNKNFEKMVNANFTPLDGVLKDKYSMLSGTNGKDIASAMAHIPTPQVGSVSNVGNTTTVGDINISLPNVTNKEEFISWLKNDGQIEKIVQSMTVGRMMGGNSYAKLKY